MKNASKFSNFGKNIETPTQAPHLPDLAITRLRKLRVELIDTRKAINFFINNLKPWAWELSTYIHVGSRNYLCFVNEVQITLLRLYTCSKVPILVAKESYITFLSALAKFCPTKGKV